MYAPAAFITANAMYALFSQEKNIFLLLMREKLEKKYQLLSIYFIDNQISLF